MTQVDLVLTPLADAEPPLCHWAEKLLGGNAMPLLTRNDAACWTGLVEDTPVCVLVENGAGADPSVADRALDFAVRTGCALVTILIGGGADLEDRFGSHLRAAHRLSGVIPHLAIETGERHDDGRLRAAAADWAAAVDSSAETDIPHFSSDDDAAAWARRILALIPANSTVPAPVRAVARTLAPAAQADPLTVITGIVDGDPAALGPVTAGIQTGIASLGGHTIGYATSTVFTGDGEVSARDIAATTRLIEFCDAFHLPLVIALDTPGLAQATDTLALNPLIRALAETATPTAVLVTRRAGGTIGSLLTDRALLSGEVLAWPEAEIPGEREADRVIDPEQTAHEILTTLTRWAGVDERLPERRRPVSAR